MKLKICFLAALCFFFGVSVHAQTKIKAYKIGDSIPDIQLTHMMGYSKSTAKISDFRDKLLILDFWATWCGACIAHFPENFAIQKKYPDQVQVLLVSSKVDRDSEDNLREFFNKRKSQYQLPCVYLDTVLTKMFPHRVIPHYVFLKNNKVLAITDGEHVTADNITEAINGSYNSLLLKEDRKFSRNQPLYAAANAGPGLNIPYRSLVTGRLPVVDGPSRLETDSNGMVTRILYINQTLESLFQWSNQAYWNIPPCNIITRIGAPEKLPGNRYDSLYKSIRFFSYEATFPAVTKEKAYNYMQADLERNFQVRPEIQLKDSDCYVLKVDSHRLPEKYLPTVKKELNVAENLDIPKSLKGFGMETLRNELEFVFNKPFLDESNYDGLLNLDLPADIKNVARLTESLKKQGILLTREKRQMRYLILKQL